MLSVANLDAAYGRAQVLFGISFTVPGGSVTALLGRNGAGKSTTLKTIMGLLPPRGGQIALDGVRLDGRSPFRIARLGVGYVAEDRRIFPGLSVAENLVTGQRPPRQGPPVWTVERIFELFPNLYEHRNRAAGQTSGGEQQMLAVARTLMGHPRLLLLDEPSEGLAPVVVEKIAAAIHILREQGVTILMSEQNRVFTSAVATRTLVLEKGTVSPAPPVSTLSA